MRTKILSLLVLLLTAASGAWAEDTYNVTFNANGNTKVVENVTLPHTFSCYYNGSIGVGDGELDLIIQELYGFSGGWCDQSSPWMDNAVSGVTVGISSDNQYFSISTPFEGTAQLKGWYYRGWENDFQYTLDIAIAAVDPSDPVLNADGTEASFQMPANDVTVDYELVRDMAVDVTAEVTGRIRIAKVNNEYKPVNSSQLVPVVTDVLGNDSVKMKDVTDYIIVLQKKGENDEWVIPDGFSIGTFRYKLIGAGLYDGEAYSNEFELFEGFEVTVPAKEFATFYKNEPLYADAVTSADAELYTISSVTEGKAALSSAIETAPSNTPLLVYNNSDEEKTFLLIPASAEPNLALDVYEGFKGTLVAKTVSASDMADYDYYVCTGTAFVWVKDPGTIKANRCWLEMLKQQSVSVRAISIVFDDGEATGISDELRVKSEDSAIYTLDGRKVTRPAKNGVYIINGKKMVVK